MTLAIYMIIMSFSDWDACWDKAHELGITDAPEVAAMCEERSTAAPLTSIRPKARPEGLGE